MVPDAPMPLSALPVPAERVLLPELIVPEDSMPPLETVLDEPPIWPVKSVVPL
jgi:hypothetical protein